MGNFFKDLFSDPVQLLVDPLGAVANAAGLPVDATRVGWAPWEVGNLGTYIQNDMRGIKHLLVPDLRRDREQMVSTSTGTRRIIYGTCRVSGQLAYVQTTGGENEMLHLVVILAGHAVTSCSAVFLDNRPISEFGDKASYTFYNGTQVAADQNLINASSGLWTADHKLLGCSYLYVKLTYDETLFPAGIPVVTAVIAGKKVYDPRTGLTAYSSNPALCALDYMLLPVDQGGMGCGNAEIDMASVIAAANICDELVHGGGLTVDPAPVTEPGTKRLVKYIYGPGMEKRYQCHGTVDLGNRTPKQILESIITSMAGTPIFVSGIWKLYAGSYSTPLEDVIDETWLNGSISIKIGSNKNEKVNTVKGTYIDPAQDWAATGFPTMTSATYVEADGGEELAIDLTLPYTTSPSAAQRLAKITLEQSRRGMVVTYPCNLKAFKVAPNDVVKVNNTQLGWSEKIFRVLNWQFSPMGGVVLTLGEEDSAVWSWQEGDVIPITPPVATILPDPWTVFPPTDVTLTSRVYDYNNGAATRVDADITWTAGGPGSPSYQLQYRLTGGTWSATLNTTDTAYTLSALASGDYEVRVRSVNSLGAVSEWATATDAVPEPDTNVPNVTGLEIFGQGNGTEFTGKDVRLRWNRVSPRTNTVVDDLSSEFKGYSWYRYYEVVVKDMEGNTLRTDKAPSESYVYTHEMNHADTAGSPKRELHFEIKAVATSGLKSSVAAVLEVSNPAPAVPANITATSFYNGYQVRFDPVSDIDGPILYTIHEGSTSGFTPSLANRVNLGPETVFFKSGTGGDTRYIKVAAVDSFGDDALTYSGAYTVTPALITAADLIDSSITAAKIADGAVGSAKLADASIVTAKIADAAILNAKIADGAITNAKILDATIQGAKIANAAINTANIVDAAITGAKIANATIGSANITDLAVSSAKINDLAVTTIKIGNNAVTVPVSAFTSGALTINSHPTTVQSVSITASGGPILIMYCFDTVGTCTTTFDLKRGGTTLATITPSADAPIVFMYLDQPAAGTYTYAVESVANNSTVQNRSMIVMEVKK